jgi:hypothetical protein
LSGASIKEVDGIEIVEGLALAEVSIGVLRFALRVSRFRFPISL